MIAIKAGEGAEAKERRPLFSKSDAAGPKHNSTYAKT